jgi:RNA polymerase sigma-70 factor (ECF subfamily)
MGHLRQVRSPQPQPQPQPESSALAVYERELDYLFATMQRMGVNPREIEDLAQEVFVVLHRHWPTLDTTRPFRPYLFAVAFRVVCAHRRRRAREVPCAELEAEDQAISPESSLQRKESAQFLMAALERVPLQRRAVLVMHDLDGFSIVDVAAKLSITRFGAYARLRKARKELASALRRLLARGYADEVR